jgi:hypothetical protein
MNSAIRVDPHPRTAGARPDRVFARPGFPRPRAQLTGAELVASIEGMHRRRGRAWTGIDDETIAEMRARSWGYQEASRTRVWALPSWADRIVPARRNHGYVRALAVLLSAYRAGAVGVWATYDEWMALCRITSRGTWTRWMREWADLGLVTSAHTWLPDTRRHTAGPRCWGPLLLRLGPAWADTAGPGVCEGATVEGGPSAAWAGRCARAARGLAAAERDARLEHFKTRKSRPQGAPSPCPPPTDPGSVPPTPPGAGSDPAPPRGELVSKAAPLAQLSAPATPAPEPQPPAERVRPAVVVPFSRPRTEPGSEPQRSPGPTPSAARTGPVPRLAPEGQGGGGLPPECPEPPPRVHEGRPGSARVGQDPPGHPTAKDAATEALALELQRPARGKISADAAAELTAMLRRWGPGLPPRR